jgi:SAM-dependent methyltransferase
MARIACTGRQGQRFAVIAPSLLCFARPLRRPALEKRTAYSHACSGVLGLAPLALSIGGHWSGGDILRFLLRRQAQGPVLELGCGIGRATIPLAQRGTDIIGLELSAPSLAHARSKSSDLPIRWIESDVRTF